MTFIFFFILEYFWSILCRPYIWMYLLLYLIFANWLWFFFFFSFFFFYARWFYGKKQKIGKGNLHLTENLLTRNDVVCRTYWQNIKFSQNCPKFRKWYFVINCLIQVRIYKKKKKKKKIFLHIMWRVWLWLNFSILFNQFSLPHFAFLPYNRLALLKDRFLKKMLLKRAKTHWFFLHETTGSNNSFIPIESNFRFLRYSPAE